LTPIEARSGCGGPCEEFDRGRVIGRNGDDVKLTSVLDLTEPSMLEHLDVTAELLVDDDRSLTQHIGEIAHQFGYQAVLSGSGHGGR